MLLNYTINAVKLHYLMGTMIHSQISNYAELRHRYFLNGYYKSHGLGI